MENGEILRILKEKQYKIYLSGSITGRFFISENIDFKGSEPKSKKTL